MHFQVITGRGAGSLGLTAVSGLAAGLRLPPIYANAGTTVAEEIGARLAKLALRKASSRLTGKILLKSKAWQKAFVHVAEHFSLKALSEKASHSVFIASLRNQAALERFIVQAINGPSRKFVSRATVSGVRAGRPVVILEKEFQAVIGETFERRGGTVVKKADCKILRVITDFTGRPITAYPVDRFEAISTL